MHEINFKIMSEPTTKGEIVRVIKNIKSQVLYSITDKIVIEGKNYKIMRREDELIMDEEEGFKVAIVYYMYETK